MFSIEIPGDLEARLLDEAREATIDELERHRGGDRREASTRSSTTTSSSSTGAGAGGPDRARTDVTPDDFGRIAAMTAKQVIQQRIREAERAMMYDEYVDRQARS